MELLFEEGADIDSRDTWYGQTPLLWAARNGRSAVVKLLKSMLELLSVESLGNDLSGDESPSDSLLSIESCSTDSFLVD